MPQLERAGAIRARRHEVRRAALIGLIAAALLAGCASASSDGALGGGTSPVESAASLAPPTSATDGPDGWRSTEIVDGDTLYISGPAGELEVRIIGVNTPESGECFSEEATDALTELVAGNELVLVADRSDVDQFGRALRYVETADGVDVGAELVANGFAIARRYPPDDARADRYADLQRDAQAAGRGLWASDACGASDLDGVEIVIDVNADAPGDDSANLNGEWVRFTNAGAEAIDLDGWEVADESSSNRYTFTDLRLEPGTEVTLFSGCGDDDDTNRYWCVSGSAVWNNSRDTVFLRDRNGNIAASLSYGDSG
ncbi:MAG TPA: lamin tail domain-containing protein [Ilumatobacteraceae bacterium]|nr:lamin tail domain-containing protein [Ilumatobacteraceae bacterium]